MLFHSIWLSPIHPLIAFGIHSFSPFRGLCPQHWRFSGGYARRRQIVSPLVGFYINYARLTTPCRPARLDRPQPSGRRNRRNKPPASESDGTSENGSVFSTPLSSGPETTPHPHCPARSHSSSLASLEALRIDPSLDVPPSPARSRSKPTGIPANATPPTSISALTYASDHKPPTKASRQVQPQRSGTTQRSARDTRLTDPYGLDRLVDWVRLQDPTLGTQRKIHRPTTDSTKGKWYIVRYGREVGVFNDWYVLRAVPNKNITNHH